MFALAMSSAAREGETSAHACMKASVSLSLAIGRSPRVRRSEAESNAHCGLCIRSPPTGPAKRRPAPSRRGTPTSPQSSPPHGPSEAPARPRPATCSQPERMDNL